MRYSFTDEDIHLTINSRKNASLSQKLMRKNIEHRLNFWLDLNSASSKKFQIFCLLFQWVHFIWTTPVYLPTTRCVTNKFYFDGPLLLICLALLRFKTTFRTLIILCNMSYANEFVVGFGLNENLTIVRETFLSV